MKNPLTLIAVITSVSVSMHASANQAGLMEHFTFTHSAAPYCPKPALKPLEQIQDMIRREASTLSIAAMNTALQVLKCTSVYHLEHNHILTIIDYSLPAGKKRLWVFDLDEGKLLYHTYVSHGIKSGAKFTTMFSNKYDSKSSSIGVYRTDQTYYGRDGLSLKLTGLDQGFNEHAENRSIVMHGGWYVDEPFIKKYGRAGRSWGCPALPLNLATPIINTIKNHSLLVAYYPSDAWFLNSKYLRCDHVGGKQSRELGEVGVKPMTDQTEQREDIFFADIHRVNKHDDTQSILAMSADRYVQFFNAPAPLTRMLRRQVDNMESIALSDRELAEIMNRPDPDGLRAIYFVTPMLKMVRGYYETQMHRVDLGPITQITLNTSEKNTSAKHYTLHFEHAPAVQLTATHQFIRWLGL